MQRRHLLTSALAAPLAACVPFPYGTYFRPSTEGPATVRRAACGGQAGPANVLELTLAEGMVLNASAIKAYRQDRPEWPLQLRLSLLPGARIAFAGRALRITEAAGGRPVEAAVAVRVAGSVPLAIGEGVDPAALHPSGGSVDRRSAEAPHGTVRVGLVGPRDVAPAGFVFTAPSIEADSARWQLPAVELRRGTPVTSSSTPYREAVLEARLAACRSTPAGDGCAQVRRAELLGFERRTGPLHWRGHFDHFVNRHDQRPVHGQLRIGLGSAQPWRWAGTAFEMQDLATPGQRLPLAVASHDYVFDDAIALDTPLAPVPQRGLRQAAGSATLFIDAWLPGDVPSFQVSLPDLHVDGRPRPIAPLRFERRSLDGGLEPFNC